MPRGVDNSSASRAVDGIIRLRPVAIEGRPSRLRRRIRLVLLAAFFVFQFGAGDDWAARAEAPAAPVLLAALDRAFAPSNGDAADTPWSPVVREIQQILTDLGFYTGPIDGRYDARLKDAIRKFERQYGQIGNGPALSEALNRMMSVRTALRLRDTLANVRRRGIEDATRALQSSPETRDLIDGEVRSTPPNMAAQKSEAEPCRDKPTVRCLLQQAQASLAAVDRDYYRDWALREIIVAEARSGQFQSVRARIRQLSDPRLILVALREYAEALAAHEMFDEALKTAESIPDDENRTRALATIAVSFARRGDTTGTRALVNKVFAALEADAGMPGRVAIATALASGLADAGNLLHARDAVALAQRFASPATTRLVQRVELGMITGALAETGQYREAMNILTELLQDEPAPAITMSASAVSKAAVAEAERYRVTTLCSLAAVQAKLGNRDAAAAILAEAKRAAGKVRRGYPAAFAHARIAEAWIVAGDFAAAERMTAALDHPILKAKGYWNIAGARAAAGDSAEAQRLERQALLETNKIPSVFDRAILLGDSAMAHAQAGQTPKARAQFQRALELGRSIEDAWWRSRAFAHLARTLHAIEGGGTN